VKINLGKIFCNTLINHETHAEDDDKEEAGVFLKEDIYIHIYIWPCLFCIRHKNSIHRLTTETPYDSAELTINES